MSLWVDSFVWAHLRNSSGLSCSHLYICSQLPGKLGAGWSRMASAWLSHLCSSGPLLRLVHLIATQPSERERERERGLGGERERERERKKGWTGPLSFLPHAIGQSRFKKKEIDYISWWKKLQSHIIKGVDTKRSKEVVLQSTTNIL